MGNWTCRRISRTTGAALLGAIVAHAATAQTYNAGQDAARRAAEQAAQAAARAGAAQLEADRQRAQREAESQRRQQPSAYTPSGTPGRSGSTSSGSGGSTSAGPGGSGSVLQNDPMSGITNSRWEKGSDYRRNVNMNPPAGTGTLAHWRYEVQHDAAGKYVFGKVETTTFDRSGTKVWLTLSCDLRSRVAEERNGKVYGPMLVEVDHSAVTRGRVPSRIEVGDKQSPLALEWELGPERSRAREQSSGHLAFDIFKTVVKGRLVIRVIEGAGVDAWGRRQPGQVTAETEVDHDYEEAFKKLAPCWDLAWHRWPVVKASPAVAVAPTAAPTLAPAPAPARAPAPATRGFIVDTLRPAPAPPPEPASNTLPPAEMERIPTLLARMTTPSTVYCSDGLCLGDDAAKVLQYRWEADAGFDFAESLRRAEAAGQHCRAGAIALGSRTLPDGRRQAVTVGFRPGPSPIYVNTIQTEHPGPLDDQQRLELLRREKERWPSLEGEVSSWRSRLRDNHAGVSYSLGLLPFEPVRPAVSKGPTNGVWSVVMLTATGGPTSRYMLASQKGCPPGIDWRN